MMKITFLSENKTYNPGCMAEHGLSLYIEAAGKTILFDTGASDIFAKNAEFLNIDLKRVEHTIISHGHYDHTEGLPFFCSVNSNADIYIHKDAFEQTYGSEHGVLDKEPCGILWDRNIKDDIMNRVTLTEGIFKISEDIVISGTIPNIKETKTTEKFYIKKVSQNGDIELQEDEMNHEQFLIIRDRNTEGVSRGIYVFSGCSHKGVIPVIRYAKQIFPGERMLGLIAGMHLYSVDQSVRWEVVNEILEENIEMVMPVHCTGINAICDLKQAMGDRCIVANAGDTYES
ncbi:MBL fold metallo-hydrolase [Aminipila terrae]|uniref:MBL fold metallo-hydrolase n=1 Tax=Aminipila terrae TaxID=2697030 RepID=A0A6P1MBD7_9FIRM|nr:MBL fold metallo-hydrolase [Aminipila terrae]QHI71237.1 MBL fold metallo-hydrolase [Aminipila terrae]